MSESGRVRIQGSVCESGSLSGASVSESEGESKCE